MALLWRAAARRGAAAAPRGSPGPAAPRGPPESARCGARATARAVAARGAASMRAAVYHKFGGHIAVEDVPRPTAPPGGVVVEVRANGLCRSDWHGWRGHDDDISRLPHVPGHEMAGVIAQVGAGVENFRVGDRVVAPFILACGACRECTVQKQPTVCRDQRQPGFHLWGSFAEAVALPRADLNLLRLPDAVGFDAAASLGCRLTTAYRAVTHQGKVRAGMTVAVFGCGGVGLSAVLICRALGARVIAADVSSAARGRAEDLGAAAALDAGVGCDALRDAMLDATGGGADVALDCVGGAGTASTVCAVQSLRRGGRLVQVALPQDGPALPVALMAARELELVGSHGASPSDVREVLQLVVQGRLQPTDLLLERVTLSASCEHVMAMDAVDAGGGGGVRICDDFAH